MQTLETFVKSVQPTPKDVFSEIAQATFDSLKRVRTPYDHFRILDNAYRTVDAQRSAAHQSQHVQLACKAGCNYCCYIMVDVTAQEVFHLADYLERKQPSQLKSVRARSREHVDAIRLLTLEEHAGSNHLCPLNSNGLCLVYDARPFKCRNFHAQRLETCQFSHENPTDLQSPDSQNQLMKDIGAAAFQAISEAYEALGYDPCKYDLGAALNAIFENPKPFKRWRDKKTAFPAECRVKQRNHGSINRDSHFLGLRADRFRSTSPPP